MELTYNLCRCSSREFTVTRRRTSSLIRQNKKIKIGYLNLQSFGSPSLKQSLRSNILRFLVASSSRFVSEVDCSQNTRFSNREDATKISSLSVPKYPTKHVQHPSKLYQSVSKSKKYAVKPFSKSNGVLEDLVDQLMAHGRQLDVSDILDDAKLTPRKLSTLLSLMRKKRCPEYCFARVFDWASSPTSDLTLNVIHYNSMMSAIGRTSLNRAEDVYRAMRAAKVRPDLYTFNSLLSSCARQGNWKQALHFQYHLKTLGLAPDIFTFNTLISALEKGGRWKHALQVREDMKLANVSPDVVTFATFFRACERGKQVDLSFQLYEEMKDLGIRPNKYTFGTLISSCQAEGRWEAALDLFDDMCAARVPPNVVTFCALISVCAQARQAGVATQLWSQMEDCGVKPNTFTYNALISAHEKSGQWKEAIQVYEEMKKVVNIDIVTATSVIKACKQGLPQQISAIRTSVTTPYDSFSKEKVSDVVIYRDEELRRPVQDRLNFHVEELLSLATTIGFWPTDLL
mmetsp:Transcript_25581/g.35314  ORF Transcript_25581/g.35314 Transcript_25581/m.35314 type:complete len:515 (+) Transcript_25581:156-1700(+)